MRKLKVYGANADGTNRVIVAATSQKAAAEAARISLTCIRDYGCETGNPGEVAQAMSAPGVPFYRRIHDYADVPWKPWLDRFKASAD